MISTTGGAKMSTKFNYLVAALNHPNSNFNDNHQQIYLPAENDHFKLGASWLCTC